MDSTPPKSDQLQGARVAFVGDLGGVSRREARKIVRGAGGVPCELADEGLNLIVIGADEIPDSDPLRTLEIELREAASDGRVEVIEETQFWQRLGLVDAELHVRKLYTPAMMAQLIEVSVGTIRGWYRRGLIVPTREVHKLPYFDFQEISTARYLAQLATAGASPNSIQANVEKIAQLNPDVQRPLAQLSVIVEGKQILLRHGDELIEAGGQLRMDFEALEQEEAEAQPPRTIDLTRFRLDRLSEPQTHRGEATADELLAIAAQLEEQGQMDPAIEAYRSFLVGFGADAEVCFYLAELLYRKGDLAAARERYYMAIELNEEYVEARANLGCVLVELGDHDLAIAAFRGALRYHADYPDAHFHLARSLDLMDQRDEADRHWSTFLTLAPQSPWADEARERLEESGLSHQLPS